MVVVVCDSVFEEHHTGSGHPESPARVRAVREGFEESDKTWTYHEAQGCSMEKLIAVHPPHYVEQVRRFSSAGRSLAEDTTLCKNSYDVALKAVGTALMLGDMACRGQNGFAALRPPGHHACSEKGMGFCLFNNIAVLAEDMVSRGLRPAVVDIDVHHGNGTQEIFYDRGDLFYLSFHQHPFYPGGGVESERGQADGEGATLNLPLPAGSGWNILEPLWQAKALPALEEFAPDILLVSVGFDAHRDDPLGGLKLSDNDFLELASGLRMFAEEHCENRVVALLEGGYNTDTLRRLVPGFVYELCRK